MKKISFTMKPFLILALILSIVFSSCKKGWWGYEDENDGGGNNGSTTVVKTTGTVYYQSCGKSIYGSEIWIKTDKGTLIQPCAQLTTIPVKLEEGDRVEIVYKGYEGNMSGFEPYCKMAYFPYVKATIVLINKISSANLCAPVYLSKVYETLEAAGINILEAKMEGTNLKMSIGYSGCSQNVKRFSLVGKSTSVNGLQQYELKVVDSSPEMCLAYFTDNICFDLQTLRDPIKSSNVTVKIIGFKDELIF